MDKNAARPLISLVIPAHNEAENIKPLVDRVQKIFDQSPYDHEIIFVDDGSRDETSAVVATVHEQNPRVKLVSFSRNFGHQIALTAGMDHASGVAVIVMDADLQHPPELIPKLLEMWREGYDIVYTIRETTADAGFLKRLTSACFYSFFGKLTQMNMPANAADFRLLDRKVVDAFSQIRERTRFLRGLTSWVGYRTIGLPYQAAPRLRGRSSYTIRKMFSLAFDGIISFSAVPLYSATYLGFIISALGFIDFFYVLYVKLIRHRAMAGWSSILTAVLIIGGIQLVLLGVIGTYLARVYEEVKQRPLYLVRNTVGLSAPKGRS